MEFRIGKIYDKKEEPEIVFVESLLKSDFDLCQSAINELEELHNVRRLLKIVELNDNDFISFAHQSVQKLTEKSTDWTGTDREDFDETYLNFNRLFLNYLSSIRTFLDHSQTFIQRKFGETSQNFIEFKKVLSFFYDESFAYRFFYRLRNYAQHVGLPIENFGFEVHYLESGELRGKLNLTFDRDKLIFNYDKWSTVKKDLISFPAQIDVIPLIFEMTNNIREIKRNVDLFHKTELLAAAKQVLNYTSHLRNDEGIIFLADNFEFGNDGKYTKFSQRYIPFDIVDLVLNELDD